MVGLRILVKIRGQGGPATGKTAAASRQRIIMEQGITQPVFQAEGS